MNTSDFSTIKSEFDEGFIGPLTAEATVQLNITKVLQEESDREVALEIDRVFALDIAADMIGHPIKFSPVTKPNNCLDEGEETPISLDENFWDN